MIICARPAFQKNLPLLQFRGSRSWLFIPRRRSRCGTDFLPRIRLSPCETARAADKRGGQGSVE